MADWNPLDVKASWVAVFLLLILWWLSYIPFMFISDKSSKTEDGAVIQPIEDGTERESRFRRIARHFRDGTLFLLAAISIDTIAAGPPGATNALAWVYTSLWIILGVLMYFFKWRRVISLLAFLDLILLIALISNSFGHAEVRSSVLGA